MPQQPSLRSAGHLSRVLLVTGLLLLVLSGALLFGTASPSSAQAQPTPLPLYALPINRNLPAYSSGSMAQTNDLLTVVAANMLNNTISIVAPGRGELLAEIAVGDDPRSVAFTPNNSLILVANRGDGTLSVIDFVLREEIATIPLGGSLPYAVVSDRNDAAFVSMQGSDEIVRVDLTTQQVVQRIAVPDSPAGIAIWGDFVYVTHFWSGEVSLVYLPESRVAVTISTGADTSLSQTLEIDVLTGLAYLPQSRSNAQNVNLTYDSTVFPVVNVLDLRTLAVQRSSRIAPEAVDRPVNMPFDVAIDRNRRLMFVANAGSNDISVIDLTTGLGEGHIEVGANPRSIALSRDNSRLYVHNALDGTITVVDTTTFTVADVLPISNLNIPVDILLGAQLFHSSDDPRLSADSWISCASCHFDGQSDGRVWQGFPDGPRNTPVLYNLEETGPYNWSATWDELQDVELKIRWLHAGTGLIEGDGIAPALGAPHAGLSLDLDTLSNYLITLESGPNPTAVNAALVARGEAVFTEQECAECHTGESGTNGQAYDVTTGSAAQETSGTVFDTPQLRWLWMSAPYFHDGSAQTLFDVFTLPGKHQLVGTVPPDDIEALAAYLLSR